MLKFLKVIEEIEEPDEENEKLERISQKDNQSLQKICLANQKNELISIVYNQLYENDPYFDRFEVDRYLSQFVKDMENLKTINHHFNRYVIWSLFDCLRKSSSRFEFVGKALKEFNLMCYGAKKIGALFDIYWQEKNIQKLDNNVIENIINIWETH